MIIEVTIEGKAYIIKSDGSQFVPEFSYVNSSHVGEKGKVVTRDLGYFASLGNAVHRLITEALASDDSKITLEHYIQRYESAVKEVRGILTGTQKIEQQVIDDSDEASELDEF